MRNTPFCPGNNAPPQQSPLQLTRTIIDIYILVLVRLELGLASGRDCPRIREEHWSGYALVRGGCGSSPHTRGTPLLRSRQFGHIRFIPAYAGNTALLMASTASDPVHPRIRGEHAIYSVGVGGSLGSSPHTRGTPVPCRARPHPFRFIPAYAGNTRRLSGRTDAETVHPRIRGEHNCANSIPDHAAGSSPHTRGTRDQSARFASCNRFIPAYAGNT